MREEGKWVVMWDRKLWACRNHGGCRQKNICKFSWGFWTCEFPAGNWGLRRMWEIFVENIAIWSWFSFKAHGRKGKDFINIRALIGRDPFWESAHLGWSYLEGLKRPHGTRDLVTKSIKTHLLWSPIPPLWIILQRLQGRDFFFHLVSIINQLS